MGAAARVAGSGKGALLAMPILPIIGSPDARIGKNTARSFAASYVTKKAGPCRFKTIGSIGRTAECRFGIREVAA